MNRADLSEKDVLYPGEAIDYFVLSRRRFYDFLKVTDGGDFLAFYRGRKLIIKSAFERYLQDHPELRRQA